MLVPSGCLLPTLIRPAAVVLLSFVSVVGAWFPAAEVWAEDLPVGGSEDDPAVWRPSLCECIRIALQQSDEIRRCGSVSVNGDAIVIHYNERRVDRALQFRDRVEGIVREVEFAYWDLWLRHRAHETAVSAQDEATKIYRALRACAIAVSRVHPSKGTFLERHGIDVVVGGVAD